MLRLTILSTFLIACYSQTYCGSGPTTTVDTNLGPVLLIGNTLAIDDQSTCPGFTGPINYTNLKADLSPSTQRGYTLTFTVITCGGFYSTLAGAWIDYNQDGVFGDGESLGAFSTSKSVNYSFLVPMNATPGITRLRVQVQETSSVVISPCANFSYGGTKDFSVQIGPSITCTTGPATITDANLGPVYLRGDLLDINDLTDCPGQIGVVDLRSEVADLVRGGRYTLRYTVDTCGAWWPVKSGAWIDWNLNGLYTNDELMFPVTSQTGVIEQSFTIPVGNYYGDITMRVQVQETNANSIDPCADFAYGGTKEFTLKLKSQAETYCQSGPLQLGSTALGAIRVVGASSSISDDASCPGSIGVQDLTISQSADMVIGGVYSIEYTVTNCSSTQNQIITSAWIDFDQNFQFSNWEQIIQDNTRFGTFSSNFKVPPSTSSQQVKPGRTRIRIQTQETSAGDIFACDQFQVGGTKDASIVISGEVVEKE